MWLKFCILYMTKRRENMKNQAMGVNDIMNISKTQQVLQISGGVTF